MTSIEKVWYESNPISVLLIPLAWLFCLMVIVRRFFYRAGILTAKKLSVPVIVVGNITVGGTGKTPLVVAMVDHLKNQGFKPGVVSRGYGGRATRWPQTVDECSDPAMVGDEAVLLARRCKCPMSVGPDRPHAARVLLDKHDCDVIISDDGLQHYALHRDIEVVVIDGARRFGNKRCLPAGPLREPIQRIAEVDFVVANGVAQCDETEMTLHMQAARNLNEVQVKMDLTKFVDQPVHAVAGIGNPQRFFLQLKNMGIKVIEHPFKDHYKYSASDIMFDDELPVLMTEKDAVKCLAFAQGNHWYVPVVAETNNKFLENLTEQLRKYNG
ncbi:tetraacyldisaccharide 4'-kinase [Kaarinaea lacus]